MKKIIFCFVMAVFICFGSFVNANPAIVYDFNNDSYVSGINFDSSSALLKVNTGDNLAGCRWSSSQKDFDFGSGTKFDSDFAGVSKVILTGLSQGEYNYYVKCNRTSETNNLTILTINFLVNFPTTAQVNLPSDSSPLTAGKIEISLIPLNGPLSNPVLQYSIGGLVYNHVTLVESGETGKGYRTWKGYVVIGKDVGESLLSFKLSADTLEENNHPVEITDGAVYAIDTIKPKTVSAINADGYNGGIDLKWHLDEEFDHFNIYRSESQGVSYTDFYESTDEEDFRDTSVVGGQTYYYKVSAVDDAGNEGDLSIEVYAAPSSVDGASTSSGLALNLRGEVDSLLSEIDFAIDEVKGISSAISYKDDEEKKLFSNLRFQSEVTDAIDGLNSLRKDAENYKQQDLTKVSLDQKIASSELKIEAIKKKVPEDITILEEGSKTEEADENNMREAILEMNPSFTESQVDASVKKSLDLIKERGLDVKSNFYVIQVVYYDGTKKKFSVVSKDMTSELDKNDGGNFAEVIPKEVVETASEINVMNLNYDVVKEDPVLSFGSDAKKILYFFEGNPGIDELKKISTSFVLASETDEGSNSITGYFSFEMDKKKYTYVILGGILFLCIVGYLFYRRKNRFSENYFNLLRKIKDVSESLGKSSPELIEKEYNLIKNNYQRLTEAEKRKIFQKIEALRDKIFVIRLEEGIIELKNTWDKNLFSKLEKIYSTLTEKNRKKLEKVFLQIKSDVELKDLQKQGELAEGKIENKKTEDKETEKDENKISAEKGGENAIK